jgi:hypothetical protein
MRIGESRLKVNAVYKMEDPKGCDYIVCWENNLEEKPPSYLEIIVLKDYL